MTDFEKQCYEKYPVYLQGLNPENDQHDTLTGFECGEGWHENLDNFFKSMENLNKLLMLTGNPDYYFTAWQIKEKYGMITVYDGIVSPEHADDKLVDCLHDLQEALHSELDLACRRTCEHCGKDAVHLCKTHGYVQYLCEPCAEKTGRGYVRLT